MFGAYCFKSGNTTPPYTRRNDTPERTRLNYEISLRLFSPNPINSCILNLVLLAPQPKNTHCLRAGFRLIASHGRIQTAVPKQSRKFQTNEAKIHHQRTCERNTLKIKTVVKNLDLIDFVMKKNV